MTQSLADLFEELAADESGPIARVPVQIQGRLRVPPLPDLDRLREAAAAAGAGARAMAGTVAFRCGETWVVGAAVAAQGPGDECQRYLVFPEFDPRELLERDAVSLARELHSLPTQRVLDYVQELGAALSRHRAAAQRLAARLSLGFDPLLPAVFAQFPLYFQGAALGEAIDRELAWEGVAGRAFLDGWVDLPASAAAGFTARLAGELYGLTERPPSAIQPQVRAIPTRQLHITAGNSPMVPLLSFLRGLAVKGAMVIKSPAECPAVSALLALAMQAADPEHPLARHTSLVYWPGGDRAVEDVLFRPGSFDRVIVWGSPATVRSVRERTEGTKTIILNPRYGASLVGADVFPDRVEESARRAVIDSVAGGQQACTSSLVHYVVAGEDEALDYCRALQHALRLWDQRVPQVLPRVVLGRLRQLRRGAWLDGTWFVNGQPPQVSSAVVYLRRPFDLADHPQSRLVVVRRVETVDEALALLNPSVSTLGVAPSQLLAEVRDRAAAAGVSNVVPLGEAERVFAGSPHDGMRVLSELVNWANSYRVGDI